ncbi:MAG: hypothetical protein WBP41_09500, partial [Saprospiraceae bacterium]
GSSTFTSNAYGIYVLRWTISNGVCTPTTADITVNYYQQPIVSNQPNQTQCNNASFTMTQTAPSVGSGVWSLISGTATITTPASPTTTITGITVGNNAVVRWTVTNSTCNAFDDVTLINNSCAFTSNMSWVFLPPTGNTGTCVNKTNCCTDTLCYGLQYTPANTGTLEDYTTGFLPDCIPAGAAVVYNKSCVMTDMSYQDNTCSPLNKSFFNSSGQQGTFSVTAGAPYIIHQVCFIDPVGSTINVIEDVITDLTTTIGFTGGGVTTEHPTYTNLVITRPAPVVPADDASTVACVSGAVTPDAPTTVVDQCGTALVGVLISTVDSPLSLTCGGGTRTYTFRFTNCKNQTTDWHYVYTVLPDVTAPTFTRPADIQIFTNASCGYDASVAVTGDVTNEADNCSTGLQATFNDVTVAGLCQGSQVITRTWSLVDNCSNGAAAQIQTITVSDTTRPTFVRPVNVTLYKNANCLADSSVAVTGSPTAVHDNCTATPAVTHSDVVTSGCTGSYSIARTWHVVDACLNAAFNQIQTITVLDTIRPTFVRPVNVTLYKNANCLADSSVAVTGNPTSVHDNCTTTPAVTHSDVVTSGCTGSYSIARTWHVVDACLNAAFDQ